MKRIALAVAVVVLLLAFSGNLMATTPACPNTGFDVTTWGPNTASDGKTATITASIPKGGAICNLKGCCQTVTISGLPLGWTLDGTPAFESKFIFTTQCNNGVPVPPQIIADINVNFTSTTQNGGTFTQPLCYPATENWPGFEIHVDLAINVKDSLGHTVAFVGNNGVIGPSTGGWDPVCYTTGCTLGFWKNHCSLHTGPLACPKDLTWPTPYTPATTFDSAFGVSASCIPATVTLLGALNANGGGANAMMRLCTAALLSAAYAGQNISIQGGSCVAFGDPGAVQDVQNAVKAACVSGDTSAAQALCDGIQSMMCPFDDVWMNTIGASECSGGVSCNPNVP